MTLASYEEKPEAYYANARPEMLEFVPQNVCRALEIGCGQGEFGALLKARQTVELTGVEPCRYAAAQARLRFDRVLEMPIEAALTQLQAESFDCVIFNDVLEHLAVPWDVLGQLKGLLQPRGCVVVSLPNMRFMPVFKDLVLRARWEYVDAGVMDRTHLRFFTRSSMESLFIQSGYRIESVTGINAIVLPWKFALLNRLTGGALDDCRFQQFACVAYPD